jgi:hypothetical protein
MIMNRSIDKDEEDYHEHNQNNFCNFNNVNIYSTSPLEKGIIFSKIENKIFEEISLKSEAQIKFNIVLEQIKINDIHKHYNKKIYNTVLLQLIKDRKSRQECKMWNEFIKSF